MKFLLDLLFRVLQLFTEPYFLLFLAVVIIAILKRKDTRKNLRIGIGIVVVLIIIFIGNGFLGRLASGYLQKSYINTSELKSSASQNPVIVVLGGGVVDINNIEKLHTMSYSRIVTAYQLYYEFKKNNTPCKIVISGKGRGHTSEAELFSENFKKMGVPDSDIIKEDKSMNTYENAKYSSRVVKQLAPSCIYLVTSGFHMKRSVALFHTFGLNPVPQASDFIDTEITIFPNSYNAAFTFVMLKEVLGIWQVQLYKTHNISLKEACIQAKNINDKDVAEFVLLHENLPDFGIHQQKVYDYVACMGTTIQGINSHYILDTLRYATDGFAWPEETNKN